MTRVILLVVVLLVLPLPCWSQEKPVPTETVIRWKLHAAPAPKPSLKYQLLPELREMNPGNPIQGYMKCFAEQNPFWYGKESLKNREAWSTMALKDLPVKEMGIYGAYILRQADYAARLDTADWQILLKLKSDGYSTVISDLQMMRELTSALQVRFRWEIAERRFDDALVTANTMFALARHCGEHPTIVGNLVGIAIASIAIEPLEEMLQQPGCPNLFWALTRLPHPFIDPHKGLQGESRVFPKEFSLFDEKAPMSEATLEKVIDRWDKAVRYLPKDPRLRPRKWVAKHAIDKVYLEAARKRLVEHSLDDAKVKKFPAMQVVLLDGKFTYEVLLDEGMRAMMLPYWQAEPLLVASWAKIQKEQSPFTESMPSMHKVRLSQARLEHRFALLRCVEALRLHAAENDGKLPAQLADIKLPLPVDPYTGKAFLYKLDGTTAALHGTTPPGVLNIRYEITIVK